MKAATVAIRIYQSLDEVKRQMLITVFGFAYSCKHRPTCSQYAIDQIEKHGTMLGLLAACKRILTCW